MTFCFTGYKTQEMDELPIQRASNPFKNQGYLLRLIDMPRPYRRRRRRRNQRGGVLALLAARKHGRKTGHKLVGWMKKYKMDSWLEKHGMLKKHRR